MPEFKESMAVAMAAALVDECPFGHEERKHNEKNDLNNDPSALGSKLEGIGSPNLSFTAERKEYDAPLGFNPHHLIPGAALSGSKDLIKWIKKGSEVKGDIGYLQNDKRNGQWLPSHFKFTRWSASGFLTKFTYAYHAMQETGLQFHMWDSSHADYNDYVRLTLGKIKLKMLEMRTGCDQCDQDAKKPWPPPYQLVGMLYGLSERMRLFVTGPTALWTTPFCTSDYALLVGLGHTPATIANEQTLAP